jgi:hypothetical protein
MSAFTENLIVSPLPDGKTWVLRSKFSFYLGATEDSETIVVPAGFITDFASVPRIFWWIYPKWGKYGNAAVIHDYLYSAQLEKYPKKWADEIFLQGMQVLNVGKFTARILFWAVKYFGRWAWNNNSKQKGRNKFIDMPADIMQIPQISLKGFLLK